MSTSALALVALLGLILAGNIVVSMRVLRSRFYSMAQKSAQCGLVWFIPILGAIGVWAFLKSQYGWEKYDTRAYPEPSEKMVVTELDASSHGGASD
jgi:uncharacterized membrane protein